MCFLSIFVGICIFHILISGIFFFNDTATTEIYTYLHTLSLHDALPICDRVAAAVGRPARCGGGWIRAEGRRPSWPAPLPGSLHRRTADRKSTRLNSSH